MDLEARLIAFLCRCGRWATAALLVVWLSWSAVGWLERRSGSLRYEESAAIAKLHCLYEAQLRLRDRVALDADGDGRGEFGDFAALAGTAPPGPVEWRLAAGTIVSGLATHLGYHVAIHLPTRDGLDASDAAEDVDHERAEREFVACAWPATEGGGKRAFCMAADGHVWCFPNADRRYLGPDRPVLAEVARATATGDADERLGGGGQPWYRVE